MPNMSMVGYKTCFVVVFCFNFHESVKAITNDRRRGRWRWGWWCWELDRCRRWRRWGRWWLG